MFYELLINQAAATLKYNLARLDYARKYETTAHAAKWESRVMSAVVAFDFAQRAAANAVLS